MKDLIELIAGHISPLSLDCYDEAGKSVYRDAARIMLAEMDATGYRIVPKHSAPEVEEANSRIAALEAALSVARGETAIVSAMIRDRDNQVCLK